MSLLYVQAQQNHFLTYLLEVSYGFFQTMPVQPVLSTMNIRLLTVRKPTSWIYGHGFMVGNTRKESLVIKMLSTSI